MTRTVKLLLLLVCLFGYIDGKSLARPTMRHEISVNSRTIVHLLKRIRRSRAPEIGSAGRGIIRGCDETIDDEDCISGSGSGSESGSGSGSAEYSGSASGNEGKDREGSVSGCDGTTDDEDCISRTTGSSGCRNRDQEGSASGWDGITDDEDCVAGSAVEPFSGSASGSGDEEERSVISGDCDGTTSDDEDCIPSGSTSGPVRPGSGGGSQEIGEYDFNNKLSLTYCREVRWDTFST
ncbi:uncharacterized protein LOC144745237 isoform X2 [Ciona intestinalis]